MTRKLHQSPHLHDSHSLASVPTQTTFPHYWGWTVCAPMPFHLTCFLLLAFRMPVALLWLFSSWVPLNVADCLTLEKPLLILLSIYSFPLCIQYYGSECLIHAPGVKKGLWNFYLEIRPGGALNSRFVYPTASKTFPRGYLATRSNSWYVLLILLNPHKTCSCNSLHPFSRSPKNARAVLPTTGATATWDY